MLRNADFFWQDSRRLPPGSFRKWRRCSCWICGEVPLSSWLRWIFVRELRTRILEVSIADTVKPGGLRKHSNICNFRCRRGKLCLPCACNSHSISCNPLNGACGV